MKEYWEKYKLWIILGGIILLIAIALGIYYWIFNAGKKNGSSTEAGKILATIPNPTNDSPYTEQESMAIRTYTTFVEGDIAHWYSIHNIQQWNALSLEPDRILIGVSNQYAADYAADNSANATGNFYNDVSATSFWTTSDPQTVLTRLKTILGL